VVGATVVTGLGALPAHASLPLTFSHIYGLPRHDAPVDVAVDGAGDVYVTDLGGTSSNDRIVKYDPSGIFLDVLAGFGSNPGDIVNPTSIAIAPNGNIYVVENGAASSLANEISYYDSGGAFLGSWGAYGIGNGQFKNPLDIAIDSVGNVYVADNVNDRIQKFASNGVWLNSWAVNNPTGVAVDGSDTVWVVTANTVKSYNTSGGLLGSFGSTNAYSVAAGPTGDLWVSASSGVVRRYDTAGTLLLTIGSGQLTSPQGLAMQSDGTLYVADTGDGRVVRYGTPSKETSWAATGVTGLTTSGGSIVAARGASTVATYGTGGAAGTSWASNGARGVTPDGSGNLWVSSMADGVVREYDGSNNLLTTVGTTQLSSPRGVSFGGGKLFVADTGNDRIVRYLTDGTLDLSWPATGVRDVLVNSGTVWATDGSNVKTYTTDGVAGPSWASAGATGIAIDGSGNVWVSSSSGAVREYTIGGTLLMTLGSGQLSAPVGITFASNKLFVADTGNDRIVRYSTAVTLDAAWGEYPSPGVEDSPIGVAVDGSNNVYVTNKSDDVIQKFAADGTFLQQWGGTGSTAGQLQNPAAIAVSPTNGNIYVADTGNQRIQEFTPTGSFVTQWGSFGTAVAMFDSPAGIAVDASGNVFVADTNNNRIQKFGSGGAFITAWGSGPTSGNGEFKLPRGIAIDGSGNVWVADTGNNRIQEFDPNGTWLSKIAGTGSSSLDGKFASPRDLDFDAEGTMWVVEYTNDRIQRLTSGGTYLSKLGTAGLAVNEFESPQGIAVSSNGDILVADTLNTRVQVFLDANGPDTLFDTGGPASISSSTSGTFNFHANEPGSTFECKLDSNPYAACSSGVTVNSLAEGAHTFTVRASDSLNNVGNPATYDWTVDVTPPTVGIDNTPNSPTANTNAQFTYHSSEPGSTFVCQIDAAVASACGSNYSQTVTNGDHTFSVWATDPAGNQSTVPATFSWTVDTTPPVVHINSGPSGFVHVTNASFSFDSPDSGATFQCHLDGTAYAPCTSPANYSGLLAGQHTFYVRGIDALGNISADTTRVWSIDLADHKPDAWIGYGGKYVGNGIYNSTGQNQTKTATTKAGSTVSFALKIENDGTDADTYTVKGGGSAKGYTVSYMVGAANYTTKVIAGNYSFTLSPGQYKSITMKVAVKSTGTNSWSSLVKVTSGHDTSKVDAVKGVVKRG
jgi:sugar lactone lactonase YvrE